MPKFLEEQLKAEYPGNPGAVYGTLNTMGAMRGNKETAKGRAMEAKHRSDIARQAVKAVAAASHPHRNLGTYLHRKRG